MASDRAYPTIFWAEESVAVDSHSKVVGYAQNLIQRSIEDAPSPLFVMIGHGAARRSLMTIPQAVTSIKLEEWVTNVPVQGSVDPREGLRPPEIADSLPTPKSGLDPC